jgi:CheY-like chemotaxis protein
MGVESLKSKPCVLILGETTAEMVATVESAAQMAGTRVAHEPTIDGLQGWFESDRPLAVVLGMTSTRATETAIRMRARFPSLQLPLIGVRPQVTDLAYEEAFAAGFDDLCTADARQIGRRMRQLADAGPADSSRSTDVVVVADQDPTTRMAIGRSFRDAGYEVCFAVRAEDCIRAARDENVRAVVCSAAIEGSGGESLVARAAFEENRAAWIISTPPKDILAVSARVGGRENLRVAVHDAFASPATLLFVVNELVNRPAVESRKSERLLYGTTVRFRQAGRSEEDFGYLFNLSEGGIYVRTLAPPSRWEELWVEFLPPRSDRIVHLEGTTAWARRYGPSAGATVPCGFGLQITGGSQADMLRYARSCRTFLAERVAQRSQQSLPAPVIPTAQVA